MCFNSCKDIVKNSPCIYRLEELLINDTPKVVKEIINDTIIEVRDFNRDNLSYSMGQYSFDKQQNLRFYGFFVNENQYRYSEEYDSFGNIIKKEGSPLLEYRIFEKQNDTILFNVFLFALNKKYENIQVITNERDTIRPDFLYKSDIYSNVKCFAFKLKVVKLNNLICYAHATIQNSCTNQKETFFDTTSFKNVHLNK